jgi:hypothetical protein
MFLFSRESQDERVYSLDALVLGLAAKRGALHKYFANDVAVHVREAPVDPVVPE